MRFVSCSFCHVLGFLSVVTVHQPPLDPPETASAWLPSALKLSFGNSLAIKKSLCLLKVICWYVSTLVGKNMNETGVEVGRLCTAFLQPQFAYGRGALHRGGNLWLCDFAIFSPNWTFFLLRNHAEQHRVIKLQQISRIKRGIIVTHVFTIFFENTAGTEMCVYKRKGAATGRWATSCRQKVIAALLSPLAHSSAFSIGMTRWCFPSQPFHRHTSDPGFRRFLAVCWAQTSSWRLWNVKASPAQILEDLNIVAMSSSWTRTGIARVPAAREWSEPELSGKPKSAHSWTELNWCDKDLALCFKSFLGFCCN